LWQRKDDLPCLFFFLFFSTSFFADLNLMSISVWKSLAIIIAVILCLLLPDSRISLGLLPYSESTLFSVSQWQYLEGFHCGSSLVSATATASAMKDSLVIASTLEMNTVPIALLNNDQSASESEGEERHEEGTTLTLTSPVLPRRSATAAGANGGSHHRHTPNTDAAAAAAFVVEKTTRNTDDFEKVRGPSFLLGFLKTLLYWIQI
jgi:hypothetical protein